MNTCYEICWYAVTPSLTIVTYTSGWGNSSSFLPYVVKWLPHEFYAKRSPQTHTQTWGRGMIPSLTLKWWKGANIPRLCAKTKVRWHHMTPLLPSRFPACILLFPLPLAFLGCPRFPSLPKILCASPLQKCSWWHLGPPSLFFVRLPRLSFCPPPVLLLTYSPPQINSHHPFALHKNKIYIFLRPPARPPDFHRKSASLAP